MELQAEYSPDGSRIAVASNQSGAYEIWRSNRDGSQPVRLTSMSSKWCANIRWSPDGGRIVFNAFTAIGGSPQNIWAVDSEGGAARLLIGGGSSEDLYPNFSRDGEWVYFTSDRNGQFDVWKLRADGGDLVQVTNTRGANGIESVDGEWLFYIKEHFPEWETSLWRVPVQGGQEEKVLESVMRNYVVVEEGIYFISQTHPTLAPSESRAYIQFYRFATRQTEAIAKVQRGWKDQGFSVSPDGRSFLFTDNVRTGSDLVMLEDFQ